jgi:hypothetical protein
MIQLITALLPSLSRVIEKAIPDKDLAKKIEADVQKELITNSHNEFNSAAKIVLAEAQGSWIKGNWRPLTMLTFVGLIVAHWLGFTPENLTEAEVLELMQLVQIGLGGYIVGRSVEKTAEVWKK